MRKRQDHKYNYTTHKTWRGKEEGITNTSTSYTRLKKEGKDWPTLYMVPCMMYSATQNN